MSDLLLYSGGADSLALWYLLDRPPGLYVALGHRYQEGELAQLDLLRAALPDLRVDLSNRLSMADLEEPSGYIPFRNLFFAMVTAAEYQDVSRIYLGATRGETVLYKSGRFFRKTTALLSYLAQREIVYDAPFRNLTKRQLVARLFDRHPGARETIVLTRSCYNEPVGSRYKGCGRCMACFRRWVAFSRNGIEETYRYHPAEWRKVQSFTWRDGLRRLRGADAREWPSIFYNNFEAFLALRQWRQYAR